MPTRPQTNHYLAWATLRMLLEWHSACMTSSAYSRYGLLLSADRHRTGLTDWTYIRAAERGELVRLRRGAYCEQSHWATLTSRDRYLLRARAIVLAAEQPLVLSSFSAAAVWGMPILDDWPTDVHILSRSAAGGRSKQGVRRHPVTGAQPEVVERDGFLVTGVARTALDLLIASEFAPAVASLDWALWRRNRVRVSADEVRDELSRLDPRYRRAHATAVIDFATHLSDSFGESMTRAVIHQLGYSAPELQVTFRDRKGAMETDYFWRAERIAGEFDGFQKYLRPEYGAHLTPGEIVWREKKREDRLRRQCDGVVRIIWEETRNPRQLDALLRESGLKPSPRPKTPRRY